MPAGRNQMSENTIAVQPGPGMRFCVFDFGGVAMRAQRRVFASRSGCVRSFGVGMCAELWCRD
eukprot:2228125-Rhodomonas_salina.1